MLDSYIEKLLEGLVESLQEPVHDAKINAEAQERDCPSSQTHLAHNEACAQSHSQAFYFHFDVS